MTTWTQDQGRMLRSARALKAYFEKQMQTSFELLTEAPDPIGAGDVQFGQAMSQQGLWGLRSHRPLPSEQCSEIYEAFHSILGGLSRMDQQRHDLTRLEDKLTQTTQGLPSNVIPLRRIPTSIPSETRDPRWILRLDCLIESKYVSEIHKMAMELHSHSRRYAFVEHRDLTAGDRTSLPELLSLGAITLFVPNLLQLTLREQEVLKDLIAMDTVQRPLLMVGATLPYAELRCTPGVHIEFMISLSRAYIKLTKPFSEYKEQGLIHYFLDSLSDNPT